MEWQSAEGREGAFGSDKMIRARRETAAFRDRVRARRFNSLRRTMSHTQ